MLPNKTKHTQTQLVSVYRIDTLYLNCIFPSKVTPGSRFQFKKCNWTCLSTSVEMNLFCLWQNSDWVITVLTVIVLVVCWLTWLLVYFQRGKEELREATALLTAQQTSLEIIVNMCCSDGECCKHGQQCWPQAFCINMISSDTAAQ